MGGHRRGGSLRRGDDVELGLVTIAISQGRFAAEAIDAYFRGKQLGACAAPPVTAERQTRLVQAAPRDEREHIPVEQRTMETEIEIGPVGGGGAR